jgi:hypothetical protein
MLAIGLLFIRMLCDRFKSRRQLEAEILVLQQRAPTLPDVLEEGIEPGHVFASSEVPEGYRAKNDRSAIKVMVNP